VYADFSEVDMDENAPVGTLEDETNENVSEHYGALKALCEREVQAGFDSRMFIVRPGLIVGPHDPTDRFTYWVRRFSQGGEVLVPRPQYTPIQFIDVRDLAEWMIRCIEGNVTGVYNATGPQTKLAVGDFVEELEQVIPNSGKAVWVGEEFLLEKSIREFEELPLWISERANWPGFMTINIQKAINHGLSFRPLEETIPDTIGWDKTRQPGQQDTRSHGVGDVGMSREREMQLLREWKMREEG
jgi:2'-hydroxyisoflavone reductase